ncbi:MAG: hypothetical protein QOG78_2712 [Rhodospirillaceae bacterium]|jgi:hypothetical protein|nr:hypothetical protein [Rhodospirillaceae bacterium]
MSTSQAFFAHRRPATSVSATRVSPRMPIMLIGVSLAEIAEIAEMGAAVRPWVKRRIGREGCGDPMTPDRHRH